MAFGWAIPAVMACIHRRVQNRSGLLSRQYSLTPEFAETRNLTPERLSFRVQLEARFARFRSSPIGLHRKAVYTVNISW